MSEDVTLGLTLLQHDTTPRDVAANVRRIAALLEGARGSLILTPELSLTGYDTRDAVHHLAVPAAEGASLPFLDGLAAGRDVIVGMIEDGAAGPCNAAVVVRDGRVIFRHRKLYLPTYGMFDEARWFCRGDRLESWSPAAGWTAGVLVCEDVWHPALPYVLATRGIDLLLVQAAAPARGVWQGGEHLPWASGDVWERIVRTTAQLYGIYVALANRVGIEGGVTFGGGSLVAGPDGEVLARGGTGEEVLEVELSRAEVKRARRPYAHIRDDDARFVIRELNRALEAS